jgi:hypothetical protein
MGPELRIWIQTHARASQVPSRRLRRREGPAPAQKPSQLSAAKRTPKISNRIRSTPMTGCRTHLQKHLTIAVTTSTPGRERISVPVVPRCRRTEPMLSASAASGPVPQAGRQQRDDAGPIGADLCRRLRGSLRIAGVVVVAPKGQARERPDHIPWHRRGLRRVPGVMTSVHWLYVPCVALILAAYAIDFAARRRSFRCDPSADQGESTPHANSGS